MFNYNNVNLTSKNGLHMTKNSKVSRALAGLLLTLLGPVLVYRDFIPPSFEKIEIEENYDVVVELPHP